MSALPCDRDREHAGQRVKGARDLRAARSQQRRHLRRPAPSGALAERAGRARPGLVDRRRAARQAARRRRVRAACRARTRRPAASEAERQPRVGEPQRPGRQVRQEDVQGVAPVEEVASRGGGVDRAATLRGGLDVVDDGMPARPRRGSRPGSPASPRSTSSRNSRQLAVEAAEPLPHVAADQQPGAADGEDRARRRRAGPGPPRVARGRSRAGRTARSSRPTSSSWRRCAKSRTFGPTTPIWWSVGRARRAAPRARPGRARSRRAAPRASVSSAARTAGPSVRPSRTRARPAVDAPLATAAPKDVRRSIVTISAAGSAAASAAAVSSRLPVSTTTRRSGWRVWAARPAARSAAQRSPLCATTTATTNGRAVCRPERVGPGLSRRRPAQPARRARSGRSAVARSSGGRRC